MAVEVFLVAMGSLATISGFIMLMVGKLQRLPSLRGGPQDAHAPL